MKVEMGYQYVGHGLDDGLNWAGWPPRESHAPKGPHDPPGWNLMNDYNYFVAWAGFWVARVVAHLEDGGGVYWPKRGSPGDPYPGGLEADSAGGNQLYNDGGVGWKDFEDLTGVAGGGDWMHYWDYE